MKLEDSTFNRLEKDTVFFYKNELYVKSQCQATLERVVHNAFWLGNFSTGTTLTSPDTPRPVLFNNEEVTIITIG